MDKKYMQLIDNTKNCTNVIWKIMFKTSEFYTKPLRNLQNMNNNKDNSCSLHVSAMKLRFMAQYSS